MIERGIVDGQEASLMYVNDAFTPVEKTYATMIVALLDDGRKIFLNVPMFRDACGRIWNEKLPSRVEGGQEAGQFGSGIGTPAEKTAAKGKRATQALARGK